MREFNGKLNIRGYISGFVTVDQSFIQIKDKGLLI
jgi:hypothetical protein